MTMKDDRVDDLIDQAARQMTSVNPSADFAAGVFDRIERTHPASSPRWPLRSPGRVATAGALALVVVLLFLSSRQTVQGPNPSEPSRITSADNLAETSAPVSSPSVEVPAKAVAAQVAPIRSSLVSVQSRRALEPFPTVPPIEIESITLDPIEMAGIEVALLEISPIRIEPVGITRQETP
ncbi:MAG: hypothetical protein ACRD1Q_15385 [Vicinamibacterales bacterium]